MSKLLFTALFLAAGTIASAGNLTVSYVLQGGTGPALDVYLKAEGPEAGLLNFDLAANNLVANGVNSAAVSFVPVNLGNLRAPDFVSTGFPSTNYIAGPSGADKWSAGHSQFQSGNPIPLGKQAIDIAAAVGPPGNNPIVVPYDPTYGSKVGVLNLGTVLSVSQLEDILGGGGTFYNTGATGTPIAAASVTTAVVGIPEPTTCILAGLALVGAAARRRV